MAVFIVEPSSQLSHVLNGLDHASGEAHLPSVQVETSEQGGGRLSLEARVPRADSLLHSLMGHYARQFWDIQKVRVAMHNRVAAMERDQVPLEHQMTAVTQLRSLEAVEHAVELHLTRLARKHPMAQWVVQAPGIGLPGFAKLMGITGSLDRFPNVAKLWAYLGMHVVDGQAPQRHKGQKVNWSPQGRVLCHQLAKAIVRVNRGPYREAYDRKKLDYELNRPGWTQAHCDEAAMRYAIKALLRDMWVEWRRHEHLENHCKLAPALPT